MTVVWALIGAVAGIAIGALVVRRIGRRADDRAATVAGSGSRQERWPS